MSAPDQLARVREHKEEDHNLTIVKEYMRIAYSPSECKGAESVRHLVAEGSVLVAPTTFPGTHTVDGYAAAHAVVMACLSDLHIVQYDMIFAHKNLVALRYTAEGTHCGKPHRASDGRLIQPTGRKARWTAAGLFELEGGRIKKFIKEWDKLNMWSQLGWPLQDCLVHDPPKPAAAEE